MTWSHKTTTALLPAFVLVAIACQGQEAPLAMIDGVAKVERQVVDLRPPIDVDASKKAFETATFALG